jgi:hypothetical protein
LLGLLLAGALLRLAACSDDVPDMNPDPVNLEPANLEATDGGDTSFSTQLINPTPPNPH